MLYLYQIFILFRQCGRYPFPVGRDHLDPHPSSLLKLQPRGPVPELPGDGQPDDPRLRGGLQVQGRRQQVHEQLSAQEARLAAPRPEEGLEKGKESHPRLELIMTRDNTIVIIE